MSSKAKVDVNDKAPDFSLPSHDGAPFKLSEALGSRAVVLFFYPKDDSPGCTQEACTFRDSYDAFAEAGAEVVGISSDSLDSHAHFAGKHKLPMKLLSDADGKIRALYGVKATLGILPGRATFILDKTGTVRHVFRSQIRATQHVREALDVLAKLTAEERGAKAAS